MKNIKSYVSFINENVKNNKDYFFEKIISNVDYDEDWEKYFENVQSFIEDEYYYVPELCSERHNLHTTDAKKIMNDERVLIDRLEHIISLFNDINLTNTEYLFEEEFGYLLSTEDSLNIDFNLEFDDEYNDAEGSKKDDIWNDTYDFLFSKINTIKEKINNHIEDYLGCLDEIWDNYEMDNYSNMRKYMKTFKPSGYSRARSLLGTGSSNRITNKYYNGNIEKLKDYHINYTN